MLGIGEVWYYRWKQGVFSQNDNATMVPVLQHLYVQLLPLIQVEWCGSGVQPIR
jgi:hypothetical protein